MTKAIETVYNSYRLHYWLVVKASKQRRTAFGVFNSPHPFSHNDQQELYIIIATRLRDLL
jgi:hypothetical protein